MEHEIAYIYYMYDPDDIEKGYVGKAYNPRRRYNGHLELGNLTGNTPKNTWIKGLLASGKKPLMTILEVVPNEKWKDAEKWWIAYLRKSGYTLKNSDDGGMGGENRIITDETRKKLSAFHTGKAWNLGRDFSEEWRRNLGIAHREFYKHLTKEERIERSRNYRHKVSEDDAKKIRSLYSETDISYYDLGKMFKVGIRLVDSIVDGITYGWLVNNDGTEYIPPTKTNKKAHRLTTKKYPIELILKICELYDAGMSLNKIRRTVGVGISTVSGIAHRKYFQWVHSLKLV